MSQLRIKAIRTQSTSNKSLPSIEEFVFVLLCFAVGALLVLLCLGDVVAAIGLMVLLALGLGICAGITGIVYACINIAKRIMK